MSENRRHVPREAAAPAASGTLAERLAEFAGTHIKVVSVPNGTDKVGVPVPFKPHFGPDHVWTPLDIRVLNWAYVTKAAANTGGVLRGKTTDEEKVAALTAHLNGGYQFTDELGGEFDYSELQDAVDRVLFTFGTDVHGNRVYSGDYASNENSGSAARAARLDNVTRVLTEPMLADKYEQQVREMIATIRAERYAVSKRGDKKETAAKKIEL